MGEAGQGTETKVFEFRSRYRESRISSIYRGWLHFAFTSLVSMAVIGYALYSINAPDAMELLFVPATFLFANFVEYRVHRGPMHNKNAVLALLYKRHTLEHHRFFTDE
jgi:hypothetical protein